MQDVEQHQPELAAWPADGLERIGQCPICASTERDLLHDRLTDRIFFIAPGEWTLWQCRSCRTAYLDPRPDAATIGLAYGRYYTHKIAGQPRLDSPYQRLRATLGNGYRNARYGTRRSPSSAIGYWLALLIPSLARSVDVPFRYLPGPVPGKTRRVLDIGCGNGDFLELAREAGCEVAGVEPDPVARALARDRGFDVHGTMGAWASLDSAFDYISMSHVIEHVHDPLQYLRAAHRLLRPGGGLYIDTPNIDAFGQAIYGRHWRGLEPPRHLVLFNKESLTRALERTGFTGIRFRPRYKLDDLAIRSRRIAAGIDPYQKGPPPPDPPAPDRLARLRAAWSSSRTEFITLVARKAG